MFQTCNFHNNKQLTIRLNSLANLTSVLLIICRRYFAVFLLMGASLLVFYWSTDITSLENLDLVILYLYNSIKVHHNHKY